nr:quinone oxidoreductase-like protein 2 homolog [Ciona intestinalis]|eukprot:XP_009857979.1 quinone oxidoreductase-like protein 2 homolog [Ciona intestinalis]
MEKFIKFPPELFLRPLARGTSTLIRPQACLELKQKLSSPSFLKNAVSSSSTRRNFFKAAVCKELGKPLVIDLIESQPELSSGEIRIQVEAVGVNFGDLLMVVGEYQVKLPTPFVPGSEMSGVILEVGPDVTDLTPGMRVVGLSQSFGAYAEEVVTTQDSVWEIPEKMSMTEAAGFVCSYGTALLALKKRAALKENEHLLVTAAAGAVGLAAVDIGANAIGAKVIGAVGSDEKCDIVRSRGAVAAINYKKDNLRSKMKEICSSGANVVFDTVGGQIFKDAFRSIAFEGRLLVIGFASGDIPQIPANHLLVKNISTIGTYWGAYAMENVKTFKWSVNESFRLYNDGKLTPLVSATFDLSQINKAFEFIKARKSVGKVIIEVR